MAPTPASTSTKVMKTTTTGEIPADYYSGGDEGLDYYDYAPLWDEEYYDSDAYKASEQIYDISRDLTFYLDCVETVLYLSYVYVFIFDRFCKEKNLNSSFFIIQFVTALFGFYSVFTYTSNIQSILWDRNNAEDKVILMLFEVPSRAFELVYAFELVVVAVNRVSATVYPTSYRRIWTNARTSAVLSVTVVLSLILALIQHYYEESVDGDINKILNFASYYFIIQCAFSIHAVVIVVVTSIISSKRLRNGFPQGQSVALKADRKLLKMTLILNLILLVNHLTSAGSQLLDLQISYLFGRVVDSLINLVSVNMLFVNYGGSVAILFLNSTNVRLAYYKAPPFKQLTKLLVFCWKKIKRQDADNSSSNSGSIFSRNQNNNSVQPIMHNN